LPVKYVESTECEYQLECGGLAVLRRRRIDAGQCSDFRDELAGRAHADGYGLDRGLIEGAAQPLCATWKRSPDTALR
jgi:hypothetical protein